MDRAIEPAKTASRPCPRA